MFSNSVLDGPQYMSAPGGCEVMTKSVVVTGPSVEAHPESNKSANAMVKNKAPLVSIGAASQIQPQKPVSLDEK